MSKRTIVNFSQNSQMMKVADKNDDSYGDDKDQRPPDEPIGLTTWNPVGELLEISQKIGMRPPVFEFGPVYENIF